MDERIAASGAKTVTTGQLHFLAMAGLSTVVMASLKKHGIEIVDDGNLYR